MEENNLLSSQMISSESKSSDFITDGAVLISYKGTQSRLIVPEGLESIGKDAFFKNALLKGVVLPSTLKSIESHAFFGCKNLESVTVKGPVSSIGDFAFADCINIKSINIPQSVEYIGAYAFSYVFGNADIKAPESQSRTYIELPKGLKTIREGSFLGCDGIVVYDNLFMDGKNESDNTKLASSCILQAQTGRALYDPDKASGHWVDSIRFKPHLIVTKSASTGEVLSAIWMSSKEERREYLNAIIDLWETRKPFNFEAYDSHFSTMISIQDKIHVAFYRLLYPYELKYLYQTQYEEFLKKQTINAVSTISLDYRLKLLQLLAGKNMLTVENIDSIFEVLNNDQNTKCVSWIMNYKNQHGLQSDYRLIL
ncbi:MAG: leucine-rich repeat domain-containing protein [Clostridia bacterium]|nr:leucine-rich repeat domain-containing protein [Clostridia bacterium]